MSKTPAHKPPGKLGTPDLQLRDDPRADPRMIAALVPFELDGAAQPLPLDGASPVDALVEFAGLVEPEFEALYGALFAELPPVEGVTTSTQTIRGGDGNDITLYIHRPKDVKGPLPCVVHLHGGGMVILKAENSHYARWRNELAATGMIVIGVEFRNGGGALGAHPFPAGLNDCAAGARWAHANRDTLGISKIILSGESGGGNLSLATAIKANREGWISEIDGVYAQCPYISNAYLNPIPELPSLLENDEYFVSLAMLGILAKVYDPSGANAENPLAWPYFAQRSDLEGLPPHVISVNELDPLRDEGLAFFTRLLHAGVSAVGRTVNGTCHAGDCAFRAAMPEVYAATIRDIKGFADSL